MNEINNNQVFNNFLCFSVYSTSLAFNKAYKKHLAKLGLTYLQYLAIILINSKANQTIKEISDSLFLESNTITPLLKRLEANGFVKRTRSTEDERIVRITLTDKGKDTAKNAECVPLNIFEEIGMGIDEIKTMQNGLNMLRDNLSRK